MGFDPRDFDAMQARTEAARGVRRSPMFRASPAVEEEETLRDELLSFCKERGWPVISARPDKMSTIAKGAHDVTIFAEGGKIFCFELKDREGKLSLDQNGWIAMMNRNGHIVHVVRSMDEINDIIYQKKLI